MARQRLGFFVVGAVFGLSLSVLEVHAADGARFMATAGPTVPPVGHRDFCLRHADDCSLVSAGNARVVLTDERRAALIAVNIVTNITFGQASDSEIYGVEERWDYPVERGDCEDIALSKRRQLIEKGWPAASLLMTVVKRENGEGHAVLTVLTDRGDLVLDNLNPQVVYWNDTRYTYLKRQSDLHSGRWVAIQATDSVAVSGSPAD